MDEHHNLQRLAKVEQAWLDHLTTCDVRYGEITSSIDSLRVQLAAVDRRIAEKDFTIMKGLVGLLILIVISMTGYIWIDRVREVDAQIYYVPSPDPPGPPRFPPLQRQ